MPTDTLKPKGITVFPFKVLPKYDVGDKVAYKDEFGDHTKVDEITEEYVQDNVTLYKVGGGSYTADELRPIMEYRYGGVILGENIGKVEKGKFVKSKSFDKINHEISVNSLVWKDHPDGGKYAAYKLGTINEYEGKYSTSMGQNESYNATSLQDAIDQIQSYTEKKTSNDSKKPVDHSDLMAKVDSINKRSSTKKKAK